MPGRSEPRPDITRLRAELEREAGLYGEFDMRAARDQAIARDALARLEESQRRERLHLRALGATRACITELEAEKAAGRARLAAKPPRRRAKKRASPKIPRSRSSEKRVTPHVRHKAARASRTRSG
jgi:hypothetical protein